MEVLVRARPFVIGAFFFALVAIGVGAFRETQTLFRSGGILAHVALFLFILTESFGSVSRKRSRPSRIIARIALVFSSLLMANFVVNLVALSFSP